MLLNNQPPPFSDISLSIASKKCSMRIMVTHFFFGPNFTPPTEFTLAGLYLSPSDRLVMCVQAENAVYKLSQLVGPADLREAKANHQFSLRASFASNTAEFSGTELPISSTFNLTW